MARLRESMAANGRSHATGRPDPRIVLRKHTILTLRFHGLGEDMQLAGFNHQSALMSLTIEPRKLNDSASTKLFVEFRPAYGMGATFTCDRAEVLDAVPGDLKSRPPN